MSDKRTTPSGPGWKQYLPDLTKVKEQLSKLSPKNLFHRKVEVVEQTESESTTQTAKASKFKKLFSFPSFKFPSFKSSRTSLPEISPAVPHISSSEEYKHTLPPYPGNEKTLYNSFAEEEEKLFTQGEIDLKEHEKEIKKFKKEQHKQLKQELKKQLETVFDDVTKEKIAQLKGKEKEIAEIIKDTEAFKEMFIDAALKLAFKDDILIKTGGDIKERVTEWATRANIKEEFNDTIDTGITVYQNMEVVIEPICEQSFSSIPSWMQTKVARREQQKTEGKIEQGHIIDDDAALFQQFVDDKSTHKLKKELIQNAILEAMLESKPVKELSVKSSIQEMGRQFIDEIMGGYIQYKYQLIKDVESKLEQSLSHLQQNIIKEDNLQEDSKKIKDFDTCWKEFDTRKKEAFKQKRKDIMQYQQTYHELDIQPLLNFVNEFTKETDEEVILEREEASEAVPQKDMDDVEELIALGLTQRSLTDKSEKTTNNVVKKTKGWIEFEKEIKAKETTEGTQWKIKFDRKYKEQELGGMLSSNILTKKLEAMETEAEKWFKNTYEKSYAEQFKKQWDTYKNMKKEQLENLLQSDPLTKQLKNLSTTQLSALLRREKLESILPFEGKYTKSELSLLSTAKLDELIKKNFPQEAKNIKDEKVEEMDENTKKIKEAFDQFFDSTNIEDFKIEIKLTELPPPPSAPLVGEE